MWNAHRVFQSSVISQNMLCFHEKQHKKAIFCVKRKHGVIYVWPFVVQSSVA